MNSTKSKENDVVTEILNDNKLILEKGINFMQNVNEKMDICVDSNAPFNIITIPQYHDNYLEIKRRGCKIRFITEITKENLTYCKELIRIVNELRHLDVMKGGIALTETEFMSTTQIVKDQLTFQCIYSNNMPSLNKDNIYLNHFGVLLFLQKIV